MHGFQPTNAWFQLPNLWLKPPNLWSDRLDAAENRHKTPPTSPISPAIPHPDRSSQAGSSEAEALGDAKAVEPESRVA